MVRPDGLGRLHAAKSTVTNERKGAMQTVERPATCCPTHCDADVDHAPVVNEDTGTCTVCELAAHAYPLGHGHHDNRDCAGYARAMEAYRAYRALVRAS